MQARLLNHSYQQDLTRLMKRIGVDDYGIGLMQPKGALRVIYLSGVSSFSANILKQETLSLGADVALPRQAILKRRPVDCILMATDSQIEKLLKKLMVQPYSLKEIGSLIRESLDNFKRETFRLPTAWGTIHIDKPLVMGILNVTPDSFSGNGTLRTQDTGHTTHDRVLRRVEEMAKEGVDLIDIGGESSRPGARPVGVSEEIERVIPAVRMVHRTFPHLPISIDTYKPEVARQALDSGACIVNDITALHDPAMGGIVAERKAGIVLMHMKGRPHTMQRNPSYHDTLREIYDFLNKAIERALEEGIERERIIVDVGIGFGKRLNDNLMLIKHLYEFKGLGRPILIGASRKSFIGSILNVKDPQKRLAGTLSALALSVASGAKILRVHDVAQARQAIAVADSIMSLW